MWCKKSYYLEIFIIEYNKTNVALMVHWRKMPNRMDQLYLRVRVKGIQASHKGECEGWKS